MPGVGVLAAEVEELEGFLGAGARANISVELSMLHRLRGVREGVGKAGYAIHVYQLLGDDEAIVSNQRLARGPHSFFAVCSQRDVRSASVPTIERPFRLAMADNEAARGGHVDGGGRVISRGGEKWQSRG
jgi:hypothetical protein